MSGFGGHQGSHARAAARYVAAFPTFTPTGRARLALVLLAALCVGVALALRWFRSNRDSLAASVTARWQEITRSRRFLAIRARHPRLWSFLAARFARGEYLGLHLTVGFIISFIVSLAAFWLFGSVTEGVVNHEALTIVDLQVAGWFRAHATPAGDRIADVLTGLGSPVSIGVLTLAVAVVLAARRYWIALAGWVAAFVGAAALTWGLKLLVRRPRPLGASRLEYTTSFSFPSGHALISLVIVGMLAYLLVTHWARARRHPWLTVGVSGAVVLAVGLSRLYLVVHYLSDVVAGYAAGLVWLASCVTGVDIALRQRGLNPWELGLEQRQAARAVARGLDAT